MDGSRRSLCRGQYPRWRRIRRGLAPGRDETEKQNVFDDFIAAGEWLIANDYTSPKKLAINGGSDWFNNTAFENRGAAFDMLADVPLSGMKVHKLRNNVGFPGRLKSLAGADSKSNSWDLGIEPTEADFVSIDVAGFFGPRQPNGDLPDLSLLKLRAGSRLIDKGENVELPFNNSAPDLGAYEF